MPPLPSPREPGAGRPSVGLLFNPTSFAVIETASSLVEHLSVNPGQMFQDFGPNSRFGQRFAFPGPLLEAVARLRQGKLLNSHGFSLSLPSVQPLDLEVVDAIATVGERLGGYAWLSEHLNVLLPPWGSEPHCEAGMVLPVGYGQESLELVSRKLHELGARMGLRLLLENPALLTPLPDLEMQETEFLNHLYHRGDCGVLLDLHNLLVSARNGGPTMENYLEHLDLAAVEEVHLAGGDELYGIYTDSHSQLTPVEVWEIAYHFLPRCPNLRAITLEYNDTYFERIGCRAVVQELERMQQLAQACAGTAEPIALGAPC
ncbi:MAG: DUF692 family multinuclear iron-containing protein [Synechococcaceae cyanobacterium]|jgi:uncharacterized protein (UPF0276 family)